MDKLKYIFVLAFLIANKPFAIAQKSSSLNENKNITSSTAESIFIHSNATTFVTGETMYYKLYCLNPVNNKLSQISKIAYIELINGNKEKIFTHKLFLENGMGQGDFFVPTTIKTGNYKLIAYSNWMLNKSASEIFQLDIAIINPFQNYEKNGSNTVASQTSSRKVIIENKNNPTEENTVKNENITINLNKKTFSNREQINLQIESLSEIGNYSLSVRKLEDLVQKPQLHAKEYVTNHFKTIGDLPIDKNEIILPELRGEMITGMVFSKKETNDVANKTIALSIPGNSYTFKIAKTNQSGKFIFNIDKAYYSSDIVLQITDDDRENFYIKLDKPHTVDYSLIPFQSNLELTPDMKNGIQERSIASQIENAYQSKKTDSIAKITIPDSFFDPNAKEYILDNYSRFPTLKETIIEVVTEMYFKQKENNYTLHLRDTNFITEEIPEPSLVLIDGLLVQNVNELFDYKTENIYKISIVPGIYYYGPKAFNGIISFTTKSNDFVSKMSGDHILKATIAKPLVKKVYYQPDYADKAKYERIPDYRNQLLWLPELTLNHDKKTISFYASDVSGTFEIILEGFTDKGIPISLKETIEVK
ncbi:hypothetical protein D3C84_57550 [compost metagenome]